MSRETTEVIQKIYAQTGRSREDAERILTAAVWSVWRSYRHDAEAAGEFVWIPLQALYDRRAHDGQVGMEHFVKERQEETSLAEQIRRGELGQDPPD